jgi:hypothetical protein
LRGKIFHDFPWNCTNSRSGHFIRQFTASSSQPTFTAEDLVQVAQALWKVRMVHVLAKLALDEKKPAETTR